MGDEKISVKPTSLILNNLELRPYQYQEDLSFENSLSIRARVILSEAQYSELGKLPDVVKVIRHGIDSEPREMELQEIAWSKSNGEIKEELWLFDKEDKKRLPSMGYIGYALDTVAEQSLLIDELFNMLISEGVLTEEKIEEMKAKITKERNLQKRREFNRSGLDLDEFKSLEED